jgi:virginiamycin B lyase
MNHFRLTNLVSWLCARPGTCWVCQLKTLFAVTLLFVLVACQPVTRQPEMPLLIEHKIPTFSAHAGGITVGSDGALWFVETGTNQIGRITVDGEVTEYPVPTEEAIDPTQGFVGLGPDGAIWFNEDLVNKLGRITPDGTITEFELPEGTGGIREMVAGPDGNLWVTATFVNQILKLGTDGEVLAAYTMPTADSRPVGMVVGRDEAFWFVENGANQNGRITLDGEITEYAIPTEKSFPIRQTVGPDDALWFTMYAANKIGRISLDGEFTEYDVPGMGPVGIAAGADGALWFTGYQSTEIGRLTTDGVLTRFAVPTYAAVPYRIVAGPDGHLWFTEQQGNKIGQIKLPATSIARSAVAPVILLTAMVVAEWKMTHPADLALGFDSAWIPSLRTNTTTRIDPASNQIIAEIKGTGFRAKRALVVDDRVWVTGQANDIFPIDPQTNTLGAAMPGAYTGLAYGFDSLWITNNQDGLDRVDPVMG